MQTKDLEQILNKASQLEKKYEWLQATKYYKKCVDLLLENQLNKKIELHDRIGFCYYKAAFQVKTNKEFIRNITLAIDSYRKEEKNLKEILDSTDYLKIGYLLSDASELAALLKML